MSTINQKQTDEKLVARNRLDEIILREPKNEHAWLQLSELVEDQNEGIDCLQHALAINPGNTSARLRLEKLVRAESKTSQNTGKAINDNRLHRNKSSCQDWAGSFVSDLFLSFILDILISIIIGIFTPSS